MQCILITFVPHHLWSPSPPCQPVPLLEIPFLYCIFFPQSLLMANLWSWVRNYALKQLKTMAATFLEPTSSQQDSMMPPFIPWLTVDMPNLVQAQDRQSQLVWDQDCNTSVMSRRYHYTSLLSVSGSYILSTLFHDVTQALQVVVKILFKPEDSSVFYYQYVKQ